MAKKAQYAARHVKKLRRTPLPPSLKAWIPNPQVCQQVSQDTPPAPGYQTLSKNGEQSCYLLGDVNTGMWGLLDEAKPEEGLKLTVSPRL